MIKWKKEYIVDTADQSVKVQRNIERDEKLIKEKEDR